MQRRIFLKSATALLSPLPSWLETPLNRIYASTMMADDVVKIRVGEIDCTFFRDQMFSYQAKDYFINAGQEELNQALVRYQLAPDNIPSPFTILLLQWSNKKILIDTGVGLAEKPINVRGKSIIFNGRLQQLLDQEQVKKEDITDVVITHFHPDHIGGIFSDTGELNYPNARYYLHEDEWNYWHSSRSDKQPEQFKFFIAKNITKLKDRNLQLIKGDFVDILPEITAVKTGGHTPGQIALLVHSGREQLMYVSDAFLHPLHIENLDWQTSYDWDHQQAKQSRIKLLELAHKDNMLVNAFHFTFPGLGRIERKAGDWMWHYAAK